MRAPFDESDDGDLPAVYGYGDPNADFHVIGDGPHVHGGAQTGVPFTETQAGTVLGELLRDAGFLSGDQTAPTVDNCFLSYVHMCTVPAGQTPTQEQYDRLERFFDAELRAINAHVLIPVGERAADRVIRSYTTLRDRIEFDLETLHASELRGRGFLVIPLADPATWDDAAYNSAKARLAAVTERDYRQTKGVATLVG